MVDISKARLLNDAKAVSNAAGDRANHLDYVNDHCGKKSIRTIAADLGITTAEVRALYNELLKMRGDSDERQTTV